ncbi:MAG: hypothetical protein PHP57_10010 [Sideroxydans sp.]|nr:hypothetical protein [Sideroxydans sp.]
MKIFIVTIGLFISWAAHAQDLKCQMLEQIILRQQGLSETDACHQMYVDCLNRPKPEKDPIRKSRCMELVYCGARWWTPSPHQRSSASNIELFKQDCE